MKVPPVGALYEEVLLEKDVFESAFEVGLEELVRQGILTSTEAAEI